MTLGELTAALAAAYAARVEHPSPATRAEHARLLGLVVDARRRVAADTKRDRAAAASGWAPRGVTEPT